MKPGGSLPHSQERATCPYRPTQACAQKIIYASFWAFRFCFLSYDFALSAWIGGQESLSLCTLRTRVVGEELYFHAFLNAAPDAHEW
jgi:hypothetical protein